MEKYINIYNYKIKSKLSDYILVDAEIAEAIAILNKKGYKTVNSCAGYNQLFNNIILNWPLKDKDNFFKIKHTVFVVSEDSENIKYVAKTLGNLTYVQFAKNYKFESIPKGYVLESSNDNNMQTIIRCYNDMYNDSEYMVRKNDKDIDNHLKKAQKELLKWTKKL